MSYSLFFDVDGTLVSFATHHIPDSTLAALQRAHRQGCRLFIATGRPFQWLRTPAIEPLLPIIDGFITMNGAMAIVDDEVCFSKPLRRESVALLLSDAVRNDYSCVIVGERHIALHNEKPLVRELFEKFLQVGGGDFPSTISRLDPDEPVLQVSPFFTVEQEQALMPSIPDAVCARWHPAFADVTAREATKGLALTSLVERLHLDASKTVAFGDGGNDVSMFRAAAIGIAMPTADEWVRNEADIVAADVDDNGIARVLEKILPL